VRPTNSYLNGSRITYYARRKTMVKKPSKRSLLAALKRAKAKKDSLYDERGVALNKARKSVEARYETRFQHANKEIAAVIEQLKGRNQWQPGDLLRAVSREDGLPHGSTYQVTGVMDHENVYVRLVTVKGKLGAETRRFGPTAFTDTTWKKVGHSTVGIVPPNKVPR
jgi:hypothetical protein